jgi:hypothetical protein
MLWAVMYTKDRKDTMEEKIIKFKKNIIVFTKTKLFAEIYQTLVGAFATMAQHTKS